MAALHIDEVLQMAMQVEESGVAFYDKVAKNCGNDGVAALCRDLAAEESEHLQAFDALRREMVATVRARRLEPEQMALMQDLIDDLVLPECAREPDVPPTCSLPEILRMAVKLERDSVRFYKRLRAGVSDTATVDRIIAEEERHIERIEEIGQRLGA